MTSTMYLPTARKSPPLLVAAMFAIRANTPYGATFITIATSLMMTVLKSWNHDDIRFPASPLRVMASPSNTAKTMIGSILASAIAATGLFGTMSMSTCVNGVTSAISFSTRFTGLTPIPG